VAAGAGLGMGIGIANQSPVSAQAQISQIIRSTEAASTAHLVITTVTTSPNPELRSTSVESGEINFTTGDAEFSVHYTSANLKASNGSGSGASDTRLIVTHRSLLLYQMLTNFGAGGISWAKDTISTGSPEHAEVLNSFGPFGALQVPHAVKVVQFEDLGRHDVHGEVATEFHFSTSTCKSTMNGVTQRVSSAPTTLWVDSYGRLIQVAVTQTVVVHSRPKAGGLDNRLTFTVTVHLFDFGAPVNVTAPSDAHGAMSVLFASSKCTG
jgi:hypothetical protein